jgi:protein-disulfide isomerase
MASKRKNRSNSSSGGAAQKGSNSAGGQRPTNRVVSKSLGRVGTRGSGGNGISPILIWTLAFVAIAIAIVASAVVFSRSDSGTGAPTAPSVVTPANIASNGRTLGDPNAPVTVDLYGDFRCTACGQFTIAGTEKNLVDNYIATGRAKLVWHDRLVIDELRGGPASLDAANAAFCAADQGKFWTMHDWLYANQSSSEAASAFSQSRLSDIGKAAGLDMTQFQPCLNQGTHNAEISTQSSLASKTINSTPTVYVDGKAVGDTGHIPTYDQIKAAIDAAPAATPSPSPSPTPSPSVGP